jgi:branched-chain amino acid transport system substrate-binding protein
MLWLLTGCAERPISEQREAAARAATVNDPIRIGFAWSFSVVDDYLPEGVRMAVAELNGKRLECDENQQNCVEVSGILGRQIELVERDDFDDVREGRLIAQEFAQDTSITAVIGHGYSSISLAAAPLYEFNGLIMLTPSATSPDLTNRGYRYIFRNVLNDVEVGRQLAYYARETGYRRMVILYEDGSYGRQLSNVFENEAAKLNITIVDRRVYRNTRNFPAILDLWQTEDFEAIFIAGSNPSAAQFVRDARRARINQPIIGSDGLDTDALLNIARESSYGTVIASFYHTDNPDAALQQFKIRYFDRYGQEPDTWAAQGYDAVYLLANAIKRAESTVPAEVAAALHTTVDWQGVTGLHTINENGDVVGKPLVLKVQQKEGRQFLQVVMIPEDEEAQSR